jgi:hypothetical protein
VVADERAAPVEFALALAPAGGDVLASLAQGEPVAGFSGWERGSAGNPAFISLQMPPQALHQSLFLLTRMADGAVNYYAHAAFEDLRITFLGPVAAADAHAVPVAALQGAANPLEPADGGVAYKEYEQALLCHPRPAGVTLARAAGLVPPAALGVTARARLGHVQAPPVQFALAISTRPAAEVLAHLETGHEQIAYSPWLQLRPGETGLLELTAAELVVPPEGADLYFLTRLAPEAANADWAWAYFQNVEILLPGAARS